MASLISSADKRSFQSSFIDFFDTFKEEIIVYKTPKKVFSNVSVPGIYGYGEQSSAGNFTLIPVSGTFSGVVTYSNDQGDRTLGDANEALSEGEILIDVSGDARNYINNGVTQLIEIKGSKFITVSAERRKDFLDLELYSFKLKTTN